MNDAMRMRDIYAEYEKGRIPFEQVVSAADQMLERYARTRGTSDARPDTDERR